MEWYIRQGVTERGPMSLEELHRDFRDGSANADTLVRPADSTVWTRLKYTNAADTLGIREFRDANGNTTDGNRALVSPLGWRLGLYRFALGIFIGVHAISLLINMIILIKIDFATGFVDDTFVYSPLGTIVFTTVNFIGLAALGTLIFSAVCYGIFFQHTLFNVRQMDAPEATMKPFEAWVWHIVPIASLWKPLEAMSQIWNASHRLAAKDAPNGLLGTWWTTWLVAVIGSRLVNAFFQNLTDQTQLPMGIIVESIVTGTYIASALCLWFISTKLASLHRTIAMGGQAEVF